MHAMDSKSKKALAKAYKAIVDLRESSYDRNTDRYGLSFEAAARRLVLEGKIDQATADLAKPMAGSGYGEFGNWADKQ